ncbi:MAG: hypothetical protein ACK4NC_05775 [Candidatus Gracilibacteria bacterium]
MNTKQTSFVGSETQIDQTPHDSEKKIIIVMGPAGAGKGTNIGELAKYHKKPVAVDKDTFEPIHNADCSIDETRLLFLPKIHFALSMTTRDMRPGEKNGETYYFVDEKEFQERKDNGEFIAPTLRAGKQYGILKTELRKPFVLREMDVPGIEVFLKSEFRNRLQIVAIVPESIKKLEKRITDRAPISKKELIERLELAEKEMEYIEAHKNIMNVIETPEGEQEYIYKNFRNTVFGLTPDIKKVL